MQNDHIKSAEEIALMRRAAAITDDVYEYILGIVSEGVTETALADAIYRKTVELGASGVSFDTIVAFGESGAEPHHVPTDKRLQEGMFVTIDMGAVVEGLCSDFTRTFAFGDIDEEQRRVYDTVYEAQKLALSAVADGTECRVADAAARDHIARCGYGEFYIHGTGHGVGTEIHEPPTLNAKSGETLAAGQVVTVEPGIYLPGRMGVRIEDMVLVGEGRPFSRHTTELITLRQ